MPVEVMVALLRIFAAVSAIAVLWPRLLRPSQWPQRLLPDPRAIAARSNRKKD